MIQRQIGNISQQIILKWLLPAIHVWHNSTYPSSVDSIYLT